MVDFKVTPTKGGIFGIRVRDADGKEVGYMTFENDTGKEYKVETFGSDGFIKEKPSIGIKEE
jgi:hypothetical protein